MRLARPERRQKGTRLLLFLLVVGWTHAPARADFTITTNGDSGVNGGETAGSLREAINVEGSDATNESFIFNIGTATINLITAPPNAFTDTETLDVNTGDITITGQPSFNGAGSIIKEGVNILTFASAADYSGSTMINNGALRLGNNNILNDASAVIVGASGTLDLNGFSDTIGSIAAGAGGARVALGTGSLTVGDGSSTTFAGVISGTGANALSKQGTGVLTLSGANTYTGITTINAGEIELGAAGVFDDTSRMVVNATSTLDLNGFNEALGPISGAGRITLGAGTLTTGGTANLNFSGVISGTGGLVKTGTSIQTLSGANTYSGRTVITQGELRLGASNVLSNSTQVDVQAGLFNLNNSTDTIGSLVGAGGSQVALGSGVLNAGIDNSSTTVSSLISGAGGTLNKFGNGVMILNNAANSWTGTTGVSAGTLRVGVAGALSDLTSVVVLTTGILDLNGINETIGSLTGSGGGLVTLGAGTLTSGGNDATTSFSGVASGTGGMTKVGTGVLTFNGTNTYTGDTNVNVGTLRLGASGVIADTSNMIVANGAVLDVAGFTETVDSLAVVAGGQVTLGAGLLLAGGNNLDTTVDGVVSGMGGSLTKLGTGTMTLNASNSFTGTLTVNGGRVTIGSSTTIDNNASVVVGAAGTLDLNGFGESIGSLAGAAGAQVLTGTNSVFLTVGNNNSSTTFAGVITGTSGLSKVGTGVLTLSGSNTYLGSTVVSAGELELGASNVLPEGPANVVDLSNSAVFDLNGFSDTIAGIIGTAATQVSLGSGTLSAGGNNIATVFSGVMSGTGSFVKQGANITDFGGVNTYTGATTISDGTLRLLAGGRLSDTTAVDIAATGTFDLNGETDTIGSLSGVTGGLVALGNGTLTAGLATNTTFAGVIAGAGGFTKQGTGVMSLTASNAYDGATTINAGELEITGVNILDDDTDVIVGAAGSFEINGAAGTFEQVASLSGVAGALVTLNTESLRTGGDGTSTTFAGVIAGSGGLAKTGAGVLTLSGINTYAGDTLVEQGELRLGAAGVLLDANRVVVSAPGIVNLDVFNETIGSIAGVAGSQLMLSTGTLTTGGNGDSTSFDGVISGTGALTKVGAGQLILAGANTHGGTFLGGGAGVAGGAVQVTNNTSLGAGTLTFNGAGNEILRIGSTGLDLGNDIVLSTSATLDTGSNDVILSGDITGVGSLSKIGSGSLTLAGTSTSTGTLTINNGEFVTGADEVIADTAPVVLAGAGTLNLNNNDETIGSLSGGAASAVLLGTGGLTTGGLNTSTVYNGAISGVGGRLTKEGTGVFSLGGINTYTGATTINGGELELLLANLLPGLTDVTIAASATLDLNGFNQTVDSLAGAGAVTLGAGVLTVGGGNDTTLFSGVISGTGGVTKEGTGVFTLSGANAFTGTLTINGGTLAAGASNVLANTSRVVVGAAGILDLDGFSDAIGSIAGAVGGQVMLDAGTLTVGANNLSTTFAGTISGTGQLQKNGSGILTLTGASAYSGGSRLAQGTLAVGDSAALGTGTLTFNGIGLEVLQFVAAGLDLTNGIALVTTAFVDTNGVDGALSGVLSGASNLVKSGAGILTLNGANTFMGNTTVSGGTLRLGTAGERLSNLTDVTVGNGATLDLAGLTETIASLDGPGAVVLGAGLLVTGDADSTTHSGVISGTGGRLTKTGSGVLSLTGASTYTGGTTLQAGILGAGNSTALGTGTLTFAGAGTEVLRYDAPALSLANAVVLTTDGTIDSNGNTGSLTGVIGESVAGRRLRKAGAGTLTLTRANTYTGGTRLSSGTVAITDAAALGTGDLTFEGIEDDSLLLGVTDLTVANGVVLTSSGSVDTSGNNGTLSGAISGGGLLRKTGAGTLTLTSANTYTGGTRISDGAIVISNEDALGTAAFTFDDLGDDATLSLNGAFMLDNSFTATRGGTVQTNGNDTTLAGSLFGAATLTRRGGGTLSLTADSPAFSGLLIAAEGNTFLQDVTIGTPGAGSIRVDTLGLLTGSGTLGNQLDNRGTLSPGSSPGTMTVGGDFVQAATGNYLAEINADGTHDLVVAGGNANLAGTLSVTGQPTRQGSYFGQSFNVIEATGTVNGSFDTVTDNLSFLDPRVVIDNSNTVSAVRVVFDQLGTGFDRIAATPNQREVSDALAGILTSGAAGSDFRSALDVFFQLSEGEARVALQQMAGEIRASGIAANSLANRAFTGKILGQLGTIRMNGRSLQPRSTGSLARSAAPRETRLSAMSPLAAFGFENPMTSVTSGALGPGLYDTADDDMLWVTGVDQGGSIEPSSTNQGFRYGGSGAVVGYTYQADDDFLWGVHGGSSKLQVNSEGTPDQIETESLHLGAHASWSDGESYVDGVVGMVDGDSKSRRFLNFGSLARAANGEYGSTDKYLAVEAGYTEEILSDPRGGLYLQPQASIQHRRYTQDAYAETGAGDLSLAAGLTKNSFWQAAAGARIYFTYQLEDGSWLVPDLQLRYARQNGGLEANVASTFVGTAPVLDIEARKMDQNALQVRAGLAAYTTESLNIELSYNAEFAASQDTHSTALRAVFAF